MLQVPRGPSQDTFRRQDLLEKNEQPEEDMITFDLLRLMEELDSPCDLPRNRLPTYPDVSSKLFDAYIS